MTATVAKQCGTCQKTKPATEFYKRGNNILYGACKVCVRADMARRYRERPRDTELLAQSMASRRTPATTRECRACGETKPADAFEKHDGHPFGKCIDCLAAGRPTLRRRKERIPKQAESVADGKPRIPKQAEPVTDRQCPACRETKTADDFHRQADGRPVGYCKPCIKKNTQRTTDIRRSASGKPPLLPNRKLWDDHGRVCSACHEYQPRSAFSPKATSPDGLESRCRSCARIVSRERARRIHGVTRGYADDWTDDSRRCTTCDTFKPWDEFKANPQGKNGRASVCRPCANQAVAARRAAQRSAPEPKSDPA